MPRVSFNPFVLIALLIFIFACSTGNLVISVLKPSAFDLPEEIKRISILPVAGYPTKGHKIDSLNIEVNDTVDINQIKIGFLNGIHDLFITSPQFTRVVFSDTTYAALDQGRIYWDNLRNLCLADSTDVVLILNKAVIYDYIYSYEDDGTLTYVIKTGTKWSFIQPFREEILTSFTDSELSMINGVFSKFTYPEYVFYETCYNSGYRTGMKIVPYWEDTVRKYFIRPGRNMRDASGFIKKNRWYNATMLWNEVLETGKNRAASRAAYNLALAFEFNDDLDQAYSWILYADTLKNTRSTAAYIKILKSRILSGELIEKQLSGP